jgi:peptidoglycan hydrolase-like protein with peptidoglycan-binding domain
MPAEADMSEADRRQIQEALSSLGYYQGPVDGIFGRGTRTAIRRFQRDIKAAATGHLTADQATRLVTAPHLNPASP